jgi:uncharacterized protein (DUF736 family)
MAVIGTFTSTREGGWSGTIRTLTLEAKLRLVPNDGQDGDRAPDFRVLVGRSEVGAAWRRRTGGETPREFLAVRLDDPVLPEPITAAILPSEDSAKATLVWKRKREG